MSANVPSVLGADLKFVNGRLAEREVGTGECTPPLYLRNSASLYSTPYLSMAAFISRKQSRGNCMLVKKSAFSEADFRHPDELYPFPKGEQAVK